jgi:hypothetical protein
MNEINHDRLLTYEFYYENGKTYEQEVNEDIRLDCTEGLHFFLTRKEAANW